MCQRLNAPSRQLVALESDGSVRQVLAAMGAARILIEIEDPYPRLLAY